MGCKKPGGSRCGRVLKGYLLAAVCGIAAGILIGLSEHAQRFTDLIIQILKPIPPIAWIPLVILWMGIGENSKVYLIFLGGFFTILQNVINGIRYTDKKLLEVASSSGIGYMISNARNYGQMDVVIVGMLAIGIIGKIMDFILLKIEKKVLAWNL